jgi:hypothetical protein
MVGPSGAPWSRSYGQGATQGWEGAGVSGDPPAASPVGSGSVDCIGEITATFTWNNEGDAGDVPPLTAILAETALASWTGASGNAANGLGDPESVEEYFGISTGSRFTVVSNPGASFSVQISPSAHSAATGIGGSPAYASAYVYDHAKLTPVQIRTFGVIRNQGVDNILIGQKWVSVLYAEGYDFYEHSWGLSANQTGAFAAAEWGASGNGPLGPYVESHHVLGWTIDEYHYPTFSGYFDNVESGGVAVTDHGDFENWRFQWDGVFFNVN